MRRTIAGWLVLVAGSLSACAAPASAEVTTPTSDQANIQVFFTDPTAPIAESRLTGPAGILRDAIGEARLTIDVAIYDLNVYIIRDALIDAKHRGVDVRMVVESENFKAAELIPFESVGIPVVGDDDPDSMHDKFLIIDRYEVWTGSMNYTLNDVFDNRNNLVMLRSTELAENYEREFEEMFSQRLFGAHSPADTPNPNITIDGLVIENYFAPEDGIETRLVELVNGANESVHLLTYSFTSDALAEALLAAQARDVQLFGIMDKAQAANAGGEFERLLVADAGLRLDGEIGSMHNKIMVIDGKIVVTGSYNFSANAEERNDENVLVIHDAELASMFIEEFWIIWELAIP